MEHTFDKDYWETHWQEYGGHGPDLVANPYLAREVGELPTGTALDAGCGGGAEAIWLAATGWRVTAADISASALSRAAERAADGPWAPHIDWVEADLSVWEPHQQFDLVMTHYAHPAIPQLDFYERIATWVAPAGTLLIVGHLHLHNHNHSHGHDSDSGQGPPAAASVTADAVTALLDPTEWDVLTADEVSRMMNSGGSGGGGTVELHDVVVRATRHGKPGATS